MMNEREEKEPVPRGDTIRHQITELLATGTFSAKDLSAEVKVAEKEVYDHLDHIRRSMVRGPRKFVITPPECRKCGFTFTRLERLRKPGKCPACRGEAIREPLFMIENRER